LHELPELANGDFGAVNFKMADPLHFAGLPYRCGKDQGSCKG
jgi:hypothetical protein